MKTTNVFIFALLMSSACGASVSRTYGPNGEQVYIIDCSSNASLEPGRATCLREAGELCGERGYTIINQREGTGAQFFVNQYGGGGGTTYNGMMTIVCGKR